MLGQGGGGGEQVPALHLQGIFQGLFDQMWYLPSTLNFAPAAMKTQLHCGATARQAAVIATSLLSGTPPPEGYPSWVGQ